MNRSIQEFFNLIKQTLLCEPSFIFFSGEARIRSLPFSQICFHSTFFFLFYLRINILSHSLSLSFSLLLASRILFTVHHCIDFAQNFVISKLYDTPWCSSTSTHLCVPRFILSVILKLERFANKCTELGRKRGQGVGTKILFTTSLGEK